MWPNTNTTSTFMSVQDGNMQSTGQMGPGHRSRRAGSTTYQSSEQFSSTSELEDTEDSANKQAKLEQKRTRDRGAQRLWRYKTKGQMANLRNEIAELEKWKTDYGQLEEKNRQLSQELTDLRSKMGSNNCSCSELSTLHSTIASSPDGKSPHEVRLEEPKARKDKRSHERSLHGKKQAYASPSQDFLHSGPASYTGNEMLNSNVWQQQQSFLTTMDTNSSSLINEYNQGPYPYNAFEQNGMPGPDFYPTDSQFEQHSQHYMGALEDSNLYPMHHFGPTITQSAGLTRLENMSGYEPGYPNGPNNAYEASQAGYLVPHDITHLDNLTDFNSGST